MAVADNAEYRQLLAEQFSHQPDINCARQFPSAEAVLAALAIEPAPDVILSDVQMRKLSGVDGLRQSSGSRPARMSCC